MKILKNVFILTVFSTLIASCTADDITDTSEANAIEKVHRLRGRTQVTLTKQIKDDKTHKKTKAFNIIVKGFFCYFALLKH